MHGRIIAVANDLITFDELESHYISVFEQLRCFEADADYVYRSGTMNEDVEFFAEVLEKYGAQVELEEPDFIEDLPYTENGKVYKFNWDKQSIQKFILERYKEFIDDMFSYASNITFKDYASDFLMQDVKSAVVGSDKNDLVVYIGKDAMVLSFVGFAKCLYNETIKQPLYIVGSYDYHY